MKQRNQIVLLVVLLAILGVVAYFVLFAKKGVTVTGGAGIQSGAGQAAGAAGPDAAAGQTGAYLPTEGELKCLASWLKPAESKTPAVPAGIGFGMAPVGGEEPAVVGVAGRRPSVDPVLQGIFRSGNAGRAIIGGESYTVGQRIAGSDLAVAQIGNNFVTLRAPDGREVVLNLVK